MEQLIFNFSGLEKKASSQKMQTPRTSVIEGDTKLNRAVFYNLTTDNRLFPYTHKPEQTEWKRKILKQSGYDRVNGVDSIDDASPEQITQVFAKAYRSVHKKA